jgi:hypothetical protein
MTLANSMLPLVVSSAALPILTTTSLPSGVEIIRAIDDVGDGVNIVGADVGTAVAATFTSYTSYPGSKIKGVHTSVQQKHSSVAVFQLKKRGTSSFLFSEQYS